MLWQGTNVLVPAQVPPSVSTGSCFCAVVKVQKPKLVTYDYGFQAEFLRSGPSVPHNVFKLAFENFGREYLVRAESTVTS